MLKRRESAWLEENHDDPSVLSLTSFMASAPRTDHDISDTVGRPRAACFLAVILQYCIPSSAENKYKFETRGDSSRGEAKGLTVRQVRLSAGQRGNIMLLRPWCTCTQYTMPVF